MVMQEFRHARVSKHDTVGALVLVAEGDRELRWEIRDALVQHGYEVLEAEDGASAMEILASAADEQRGMPDVHRGQLLHRLLDRDGGAAAGRHAPASQTDRCRAAPRHGFRGRRENDVGRVSRGVTRSRDGFPQLAPRPVMTTGKVRAMSARSRARLQ